MGRTDKHKLGSTRNNAVFKVVGGKTNKGAGHKGKPKGVDIKLKKLAKGKKTSSGPNKNPDVAAATISNLDAQLTKLQHGSATFRPKDVPATKPVTPIKARIAHTDKAEVDAMVEDLGGIMMKKQKTSRRKK